MTTPAHKRSWLAPLLIGGGGLLTVGATIFAVKKSSNTVRDIEKAVDAPPVSLPMTPAMQAALPTVDLRPTGYWPFTARTDEKQMEGGVFDRMMNPAYKSKPDSQQYKDHILHTVEQHLANPVAHPFVSLSGDDAVWPYGQKLLIPWNDGKVIVGRVVDTGSHFRGIRKLYRVAGREPMDVCVQSSESIVPKAVTAQIVPGDHFAGSVRKGSVKEIATAGLKGQNVRLSGDEVIREGNTPDDYEALARMVESETGGRTLEEQHAAAWVARNRAADLGLTLHELLAPKGKYGSPQQSGGYASTRRTPTDRARLVAAEVLDAWPWVDPTGGAVEFWMPEEQNKLHALGDVYRASSAGGDAGKMKNYARYADYGTETDVRAQYQNDGLHVVGTVGSIELLGRMM